MDPRFVIGAVAAYLFLKPSRQSGFGAFDPKVIKGERGEFALASRIPHDPEKIEMFRMGFEAGLKGRATDVAMEATREYRDGYAVGRESRGDSRRQTAVEMIIRSRIEEATRDRCANCGRKLKPDEMLPGHRTICADCDDSVVEKTFSAKASRRVPRLSVREVAMQFAKLETPAKSSGALRTDGTSIWSYKKLIAQKRKQEPGDNVCYVESRRYSKTTSKHQHMIRTALHLAGWKIIEVEFP